MFNPVFNEVITLIEQRQLDEALSRIKVLHITCHDRAGVHQQVHLLWLYIGFKKGDGKIMAGQLLPLIFAIPVSWVHRCFGIAVKAHKQQ